MEEAANGGEQGGGARIGGRLDGAGAQELKPAGSLKIAQAAGRLLHIGLEAVDGLVKLGVARARGAAEQAQNLAAVGVEEAGEAFAELAVEADVAGEEAFVKQADGEFEVAVVERAGLLDGVDGLAAAQAAVPQAAYEIGDGGAGSGVEQRPAGEDQQIDIGIREQLAAPVAADGDQRESFRESRRERRGLGLENRRIDAGGARFQELQRVAGLEKPGAQIFRELVRELFPRARHCVCGSPPRRW